MDAPICRFVREYAAGGSVRLHMPGHKGRGALGCEAVDITEICGADDLSCPESRRCCFWPRGAPKAA